MNFAQAMKDIANGYYVNRGKLIIGPLRSGLDLKGHIWAFKDTEAIEKGVYISEYKPSMQDIKAKNWEAFMGDSKEEEK